MCGQKLVLQVSKFIVTSRRNRVLTWLKGTLENIRVKRKQLWRSMCGRETLYPVEYYFAVLFYARVLQEGKKLREF